MGKERKSEWYNKKYENKEKHIYGRKGGLYEETYKLFSGKNILDIGCGSGRLAKVLKDNNFTGEYLGIDFAENAINYCKVTYPYGFKVSNVFDITIEKKFDTIISLEVFEHINDDISLIEGIPKKKTIILSVPSFGGPSHVRYFQTINDVKNRYKELIEFEKEIKIDRIFLLKGKRR